MKQVSAGSLHVASLTHQPGLCLDCSYPLRGLSQNRCPECGREFDPSDQATMNMGKAVGAWVPWVLGPIRWPIYLGVIAAAAVTLWYARLPGFERRMIPGSPIIWSIIAILWISWPLLRCAIAWRNNWPRTLRRTRWTEWLLAPLLMITLIVALLHRVPLRVGFAVSQPAMDRWIAAVKASDREALRTRWLGVYPVSKIRRFRTGIRFTADESTVAYKAGFLYLPDKDPSKESYIAHAPMKDGWWTWREDW